jgi:ABC-type sugar transport system ATPase subunit
MNILRGGTVADGVLHVKDLAIPLPNSIRDQVSPGQQLILGIRPTAAQLIANRGEPTSHARQSGIIESVEPDFARETQLAYVRTGELFYAAKGPLDHVLNVGDTVDVAFPVDELYFFDAASEQRIR